MSPSSNFRVPVLDEVFAESRLGNPDEQVSVEKHKKHNCPMGHLKPSEGKGLVARKNFCQSVPNPPMKIGEPWATIGQAANNAGRWTNIPDANLLLLSKQCRCSGGSGATLRAVSLRKPAIEKEARLRSQHIPFRSGNRLVEKTIRNFGRWGTEEVAPSRS